MGKWRFPGSRFAAILVTMVLPMALLGACDKRSGARRPGTAAVGVTLPSLPRNEAAKAAQSLGLSVGSGLSYAPFHLALRITGPDGASRGHLLKDGGATETDLEVPVGTVRIEAIVFGQPVPAGGTRASACAAREEGEGARGAFVSTYAQTFEVGPDTESIALSFPVLRYVESTPVGVVASVEGKEAAKTRLALLDGVALQPIVDPCAGTPASFATDAKGRAILELPFEVDGKPRFAVGVTGAAGAAGGLPALLAPRFDIATGRFLSVRLDAKPVVAPLPPEADFFDLGQDLASLSTKADPVRLLRLARRAIEGNVPLAQSVWAPGLALPAPVASLAAAAAADAGGVVGPGTRLSCGWSFSFDTKDAGLVDARAETQWSFRGTAVPNDSAFRVPPGAAVGDAITCRVRVRDVGFATTSATVSPSAPSPWSDLVGVKVTTSSPQVEAPPAPASVGLDPEGPLVGDSLLCSVGDTATPNASPSPAALSSASPLTAVSSDDLSLERRVRWYRNGTAIPAASSMVLSTTGFAGGDTIRCEVATANPYVASAFVVSATRTLGASLLAPPAAISLSTLSPHRGQTLSCAAASVPTSPRGPVTLSYRWRRGTQLVAGATGSTLSLSGFSVGNEVRCEVSAGDGVLASDWVASADAIVTNRAPTPPTSVTVTSSTPSRIGSFTCGSSGAGDPDGDAVIPVYAWLVDGAVLSNSTSAVLAGSTAGVTKGKTISCRVSSFDGTATSASVTSAEMTVANALPTPPTSVSLTPINATRSNTLTCGYVGDLFDADGEPLSPLYTWYKDGVFQVGQVTSTFDLSSVPKNAGIVCAVALGDTSAGLSSETQSLGVTVQNAPPTAPLSVTVTATSGGKDGLFSCNSNLGSDADGDTLQARYQWYVGSSPLSGETGSNVSGSRAEIVEGAALVCKARAWDGTIEGDATASSYTVQNAPVSGSISCDGSDHIVGKSGQQYSFTCLGAFDADGSADVSYQLQFDSGSGCPNVTASGGVSGTLGAVGTCQYRIKACDESSCVTTPSRKVVTYDLTAALDAPALDSACTLRFAAQINTTSSPSLTGLTYAGTANLAGEAAGAAGLVVSLDANIHSAGDFVANWGVTSGGVGGSSPTSEVYASAPSLPFTLTKTTPSLWTQRLAAASLAGNVQSGRQVPAQTAQGNTCVSKESGNPGMIVAGTSHVCTLSRIGNVHCWGRGGAGQIGDGFVLDRLIPTAVPLSGVKAIAAGSAHTCAITSTDDVACWGDNASGQLGDNTTTNKSSPTVVSGVSGVVAIAAGDTHTCALTNLRAVSCWGNNGSGQLGIGNMTTKWTPQPVSTISNVVAIDAAGAHTCAIESGGTVKCWGANGFGQLGTGGNTATNQPGTAVSLGDGIFASALALGSNNSCALLSSGGVRCWGLGTAGQLGQGFLATTNTPATVGSPTPVLGAVAIAQSGYHGCAIVSGGVVKCWGNNTDAQLGKGDLAGTNLPAPVTILSTPAVAIAAEGNITCALLASGEPRCWGSNDMAQMGDDIAERRATPAAVDSLGANTVFASAGGNFACALSNTGGVNCWGANASGQLGNNSLVPSKSPVAVVGLSSGVSKVATGGEHACALLSNGTVTCWGNNTFRQLADNSTTDRSSPVPASLGLPGGVTVVDISAGGQHTCAVLSDGTAKCWGSNGSGQLGVGNAVAHVSPVLVLGLTAVQKISAGPTHTCAVDSSKVYCWGDNTNSKLGLVADQSSPVAATITQNASDVSTGATFTCARVLDQVLNQVKCWGAGSVGQLGGGALPATSVTPLTVSGINASVSSIATGSKHACAIEGTTLRCWGWGEAGQVGTGGFGISSTPAVVSGAYMSVTAQKDLTCAVTTGGEAKCWGDNSDGAVGDPYLITRFDARRPLGLTGVGLKEWVFGLPAP